MSIEIASRIARSEAIIYTDIGETIVMMDADQGRYYELDPIGARIWELITSGPSVAAICETLAADYDVDTDTCRSDVLAFLEELSDLGVVRVVGYA